MLEGGSGNNDITGGSGDDTLSGGSGGNVITGDDGNDLLEGGSGGNNIVGGTGNDTISAGSGFNDLTGGTDADTFFFSKVNRQGRGISIIGNEVVEADGGDEAEAPISKIADFNVSEGDKIQLDGSSFEVAPGDTSTLQFDNNTGILSLADTQVVEITGGVDSEVLANTEIVEGDGSVAVGGDGDDAIAEDGEVAIGGDGGDATGNADGSDGNVDVDRFFEPTKGFHFYTSSEQERDTIQQQSENGELSYTYEGESFSALAEDDDGDPLTGAKPIYRFFNDITGAHLYTIAEAEKNNIVENLSDYNLEGVAYYAYDTPQENTIPLYRLYNADTGTHFFTPSAAERDNALDNLSGYSAEGEDAIAFHVLPIDL